MGVDVEVLSPGDGNYSVHDYSVIFRFSFLIIVSFQIIFKSYFDNYFSVQFQMNVVNCIAIKICRKV